MKTCPYCRRAPGVERVGATALGGVFRSWTCETCQRAVDQAMAALVIVRGVARGDLSSQVLLQRMR